MASGVVAPHGMGIAAEGLELESHSDRSVPSEFDSTDR